MAPVARGKCVVVLVIQVVVVMVMRDGSDVCCGDGVQHQWTSAPRNALTN